MITSWCDVSAGRDRRLPCAGCFGRARTGTVTHAKALIREDGAHGDESALSASATWACRWPSNLIKAGHQVAGFDVSQGRCRTSSQGLAASRAESASRPARRRCGHHHAAGRPACSRGLSRRGRRASQRAKPARLLIDCSTIDVETARAVAATPRREGPADARCAGVGRRRRRAGGHADLHGRRPRRAFARAQADPAKRWARPLFTRAARATDRRRRSATT